MNELMEQLPFYSFTPQERLFFERALQQFNSSVAAGIQLICTQQELPGQWRLKFDASGLERIDVTPAPAAPEVSQNGLAS